MNKFLGIASMIILFQAAITAQWSGDSTQNNPICKAIDDQTNPLIVSDGNGGGIIIWIDNRNSNGNIYAQRIDENGSVLWTNNGISVSIASNDKDQIHAVSDGNSGALIVWTDRRNGGSSNTDIYAQRIDANGNQLWTANGVAVCKELKNQLNPQIIEDGSNGAIIVWGDNRNSTTNGSDIYAQRISSGGNILWQTNGNIICDNVFAQVSPKIEFVDDDTTGVIIFWEDNRNASNGTDIYAQRISLNGTALWEPNGKSLITAQGNQRFIETVSSLTDEIAFSWEDSGIPANDKDIHLQVINKYGTLKWTNTNFTNRTGSQVSQKIASDGNGNIFLTYRDLKYSVNWISVQKIDSNGNIVWADTGIVVSKLAVEPYVLSDGFGNAIVIFEDGRNPSLDDDIYASKLDANGNFLWNPNGVPVSTVLNNQGNFSAIKDNSGGAIIVWEDDRTDTSDIYASRLFSTGNLTSFSEETIYGEMDFVLNQNYPNPFNPATTISFSLSERSSVSLKIFDILGNEIVTLVNEIKDAGEYEVKFDAAGLSSGIYFYKIEAGGNFRDVKKMTLLK
ncbi:MAG: T9SS type A sorting domain-containing protein [Ignavibacteriaceae bacterium]|nr:T9SS type A sorting domain-containing protein [Ignavibacteriaceae bacterium]